MDLTVEQIRHVADLAMLSLTEAELTRYQRELSAIISYASILDSCDTSSVSPTPQTSGSEDISRADQPHESQKLNQSEALANAPSKEEGYFKTKPVFN